MANRLPDWTRSSFARTNRQTIIQRAAILRELMPAVHSIGELCCGDCAAQFEIYTAELGSPVFRALDLAPEIVALNCARNILCVQGDVMDAKVLRPFLSSEVLFFGPPLSEDCDGHRLLTFQQVLPGYADFARVLWRDMNYQGTGIFIGPNTTTPGDARWLYEQIQTWRADVGLRLLHYSHATQTGNSETHSLRLKYIELWFSSVLPNQWETRHSHP